MERGAPQRATQGFVATLTHVWNRPSLTAIEIAWRWVFGIPAALLLYRVGERVLDGVPWRDTGVGNISANQLLTDPLRASAALAAFVAVVLPGVERAAVWMGPLLFCYWVVVSTVGRTLLLRRLDGRLRPRPLTLLLLQGLRVLPIAAVGMLWWFGVQALATYTIVNPILQGSDPQMMVYVGCMIVLSLGLFVFAAGVGWVFTAAPVIAMRDGLGAFASLRAIARLRDIRGSLFEINMVLAIVKIMLLVLAVAFSAFPLPFANVMTEGYILIWSALITVWYFVASDLFHVARLSAYATLLHNASPPPK